MQPEDERLLLGTYAYYLAPPTSTVAGEHSPGEPDVSTPDGLGGTVLAHCVLCILKGVRACIVCKCDSVVCLSEHVSNGTCSLCAANAKHAQDHSLKGEVIMSQWVAKR